MNNDRATAVIREVQAAVPAWASRLTARRRVESAFSGLHQSGRKGPGDEWAEARGYEIGDDVRRIDWSATARVGAVQVRDTIADRSARITLVVDCSASMRFGTDTITKADVALAACAAVALVAARQGDATGALLATGAGTKYLPAGSGSDHVNVALRKFASAFAHDGPVDFPAVLRQAHSLTRSAGVVVVVSDFHDERSAEEIRRLAVDHRTIAVVVDDVREREMVPVGTVTFVDPETDQQFTLDTDATSVRAAFASIANRRRSERIERLTRAGVEVAVATTGESWLTGIADLARRLA